MIVVPCYLHYNISLQSQFIKKKKNGTPSQTIGNMEKKISIYDRKN